MKEFKWLVECKTKTEEELSIAAYPDDYEELARWKTTDLCLALALTGLVKNAGKEHESFYLLINAKDMEEAKNAHVPLSGRLIVKLILEYVKTDPSLSTKFSWDALCRAKWKGGHLGHIQAYMLETQYVLDGMESKMEEQRRS